MRKTDSLLEKRKHGTEDFPCAIYRQNGNKTALAVNHHWHRQVEIIHLISGGFQVEINMTPIQVNQEAFLYVNSGELHRIYSKSTDYKEEAIVFDLDFLETEVEDIGQRKVIRPLLEGKKKLAVIVQEQDAGFRQMKNEYEKIMSLLKQRELHTMPEVTKNWTPGEAMLVKGALLSVIAWMECFGWIEETNSEEEDYRVQYLKKILTYIREHYSEKIKLSQLAGLVGMNEQYFCRFFKQMTGSTPIEYMNEYRIHRAAQKLTETRDSITVIAMDCGYHHMGNFIEMFKKQKKCTPSEYRKRILSQNTVNLNQDSGRI